MSRRIKELTLDQLRAEGREKGIREGKLITLIELVNDGLIAIADAANEAGVSEKEFAEYLNKSK